MTTKPTISKAEKLRQAIVDYRVMCDMAYSEFKDKFYTEAQYRAACDWQLERVIDLIADQQRQLLSKLKASLPEVSAAQDNDFSNGYTLGFNAAIDGVIQVIKDIREGL